MPTGMPKRYLHLNFGLTFCLAHPLPTSRIETATTYLCHPRLLRSLAETQLAQTLGGLFLFVGLISAEETSLTLFIEFAYAFVIK